MRLAGKTALVTGAGGPMGGAIALRLAEEGASVIMADISANRLSQRVADIKVAVPTARLLDYRCDATVEQEAATLVAEAEKAFPAIDILVNVVGGIRDKTLYRPFEDIEPLRWEQSMNINVMANVHLIRKLAPAMRSRRYGKIINISSINFAGEHHSADYGAMKAAVASITRTLAIEYAPFVNVNCVAPGLIKTLAIDAMKPEDVAYYAEKPLLKRMGEPRDIANAVLFLASEESSYVTGEILRVSGGIWPSL